MKTKIIGLVLLTTILLASMVVALSFSVSTPVALTKSASSATFTITNSDVDALNMTLSIPNTVSDSGSKTVSFSTPNQTSFQLPVGNSTTITVNRGLIPSDFDLGVFTSNIVVTAINASNASQTSNKTVTLTFVNGFCDEGPINDTDLELSVDIENLGEGDDDGWIPLDEIEINVVVDNEGDDDVDDVIVELGLIEASTGKNVADDLIWISEDKEKFDLKDIKDGKDKEHTFIFKVDADMGSDEEDYFVFVKAYTEKKEDELCIDYSSDLGGEYYESVSIEKEDDDDRLVIVDDIQIEPEVALCDEEVTVRAKVYNIGEDKQEKVKVKFDNEDLGVSLYVVLDDLDDGESETVEFTFEIPKNASEETYTLKFRNLYDYDDDEDEDEDASYDENSELFTAALKVEGNCLKYVERKADISATLGTDESDIRAGREVVIMAEIENTGEETTTYTIGVDGNELFSTTESIEPAIVTLEPGESEDVVITLKLNRDAEGEQIFDIEVYSDGAKITQSVSLTVPESWTKSLGFSALKDKVGENWFIWAIVAINVILIIAIIIVAVKVTKA